MVGNMKVTPKGKNVKDNKMTKNSSISNTFVDDKSMITDDKNKGDPSVDGALIGKKFISKTPPFLFTFEIFNRNVHNYLVDFGDLSNVIPYSVCKKLNAEPQIFKTRIIQLDRSNMKVMDEMKYVLIHLTSNPKVHQTIGIIVVNIPIGKL